MEERFLLQSKSWLKDREQTIRLNGAFYFQEKNMESVLFNVFIRDLVKGIHSEISKFTDCTKLFFRQPTLMLMVKNQEDHKNPNGKTGVRKASEYINVS